MTPSGSLSLSPHTHTHSASGIYFENPVHDLDSAEKLYEDMDMPIGRLQDTAEPYETPIKLKHDSNHKSQAEEYLYEDMSPPAAAGEPVMEKCPAYGVSPTCADTEDMYTEIPTSLWCMGNTIYLLMLY